MNKLSLGVFNCLKHASEESHARLSVTSISQAVKFPITDRLSSLKLASHQQSTAGSYKNTVIIQSKT